VLAGTARFRRNKHSPGRNHRGPNFPIEFGMAFEQRSVKAKAERIASLRLLSPVLHSFDV
jgi:hypothetical protein